MVRRVQERRRALAPSARGRVRRQLAGRDRVGNAAPPGRGGVSGDRRQVSTGAKDRQDDDDRAASAVQGRCHHGCQDRGLGAHSRHVTRPDRALCRDGSPRACSAAIWVSWRIAFGNGTLSVKRDFHPGPRWGGLSVGATEAPAARRFRMSERCRRRATSAWTPLVGIGLSPAPFAVSRPPRVHASVRGQREAANIMPGPVRSRAPISQACSNASVRRRGNTRRLGDRVPVGTSDGRRLRARPKPSAFSPAAGGAHAAAPERQAAPAAALRVRRKSALSTHIRCRITPIRRAMATTARFIPRRRATCRPHAFSQHGLA